MFQMWDSSGYLLFYCLSRSILASVEEWSPNEVLTGFYFDEIAQVLDSDYIMHVVLGTHHVMWASTLMLHIFDGILITICTQVIFVAKRSILYIYIYWQSLLWF